MPFTVPTFQEKAESEIIDSIIEVVHRDMKLALDYFYWTAPDRLIENLPAFEALSKGEDTLFDFPYLVAWLGKMDSVETEAELRLDQDLRVLAGLAVKDATVSAAKDKAAKYVRAFKAVIRSAPEADLFPTANLTFETAIDISHEYLRHGTNSDGEVVQPVRFELKFKFGEK